VLAISCKELAAPMFVLPYGVLAQIDCDNRRFEILENAVVD